MRCDRAGARPPAPPGRSSSAGMARRVGYGVGGGGGGFGGLGGGGFGGLNGSMTTFPSVCAVGEPCSIASVRPSGQGRAARGPAGAIPIAGPQEIFHGVDCRDPGTWERRAAPQVVSRARAAPQPPIPLGRLRSKIRTYAPAPGLLLCTQAGGTAFPSSYRPSASLAATARSVPVVRTKQVG
jgi:hypothetical protein